MNEFLLRCIGIGKRLSLLFIGFLLAFSGWAQTYEPTVTVYNLAGERQDDFAPGETAVLKGTGWTQDQFVDVHLHEDPEFAHDHDFHNRIVDTNGNWEIQYPIEERHLGVTFNVEVHGLQSGYTAITVFTDKVNPSVTLSSSLNPSAYGNSVIFTATITGTSLGGSPPGKVDFKDNGISIAANINVTQTSSTTSTATFTTLTLNIGTHPIKAFYQATGSNYSNSESGILSQVVNSTSCTQPTMSCPSQLNIAVCNGTIPAGATTPADFVALGGTTNATSISYVDGTPSLVGCTETTIRTYTATSGTCTNTFTQTITRTVDTEAPTITTDVADTALGCNPTTIEFGTPVFAGRCSAAVAVATYPITGEVVIDGCNRSQTKTWKVTDCSGLETETSQTLTWTEDNTAPAITTDVADAALGCNPETIVFGTPVFDGGCSDVEAVATYPITGEVVIDGCNRSQTKTWKVTDCSGLETETSQTLTWTEDNTAPAITTDVADAALGCNPETIVFGTPVFDGGCSDVEAVATYPITGEIVIDGCNRSQTKTWKVTDCSGLETETSQTLTWTEDNTAPAITTDVADAALGCNPETIVFGTPVFDGGCSDVEAVATYPITGEVVIDGCNRSQTKTWKVTDCSGLETETSQTLTWTEDNTAPAITTNVADAALGCNPETIVFGTPVFDGGCSDVEAVATYPITGEIVIDGCNRSQTKTWKVTDCSGLETETSQTLTWTEDNTAPAITTDVADAALGCNPETIVFGTPVFDGGCSDVEAVATYPITGEVVIDGCNRSQTKTWKVTDCSGLETETSQTLTWTVDTEAPTITQTSGELDGADLGCNPEVVAPEFELTEACSPGDIIVVDSGVTGAGCEKSQTWTANFTDACTNAATEVSVTYTWTEDTTAPDLGAIVEIVPQPVNTPSTPFILKAPFTGEACSTITATWYFDPNGIITNPLSAPFDESGYLENGYIKASIDSSMFGTLENPTGTGVYSVMLVVSDACSNVTIKTYDYLVIYDPSGGFVTGGGWIDSPAGAYTDTPSLVGKASFGFNAKYKPGKNTMNEVDGNTNFQFKAGDLHFKSSKHTAAELVISGDFKATYTGEGTINGGSVIHNFRVTVIDAEKTANHETDLFRIKIWEKAGGVLVYDNNIPPVNQAANADPSTAISGGSIVIHKPKGKGQEDITKGTPVIMEDLRPEILETLAASPNPVVSSSTVRFSVKEDAVVTLRLFDHSGRMIETLYQGNVKAFENYDVDFQRRNLMSGIYIVKLTTATGHSYEKRIIIN